MNEKKALIICDGLFPEFSFIRERIAKAQFVIACDGAANHLLKNYITPHLIIGDMDSFLPQNASPDLFIIKDPNQETNDLEKALIYVLGEGFTHIEIMSALGKRIDHTMKNLSVMLQFNSKFKTLYIRDEHGISFIAPSDIELQVGPGTTISIIPLSGKVDGITTSGLAYSLSDESLEVGKRDGTSNVSVSNTIRIQKKVGDLMIFIGLNQIELADLIHKVTV